MNRNNKATTVEHYQAGGFAFLPAAAAIYGGLKTIQPFSKAKNWLSTADILNGKRDSKTYKVFKAVADAGSAAGFGENKKERKRKRKRKSRK
jgi:hypothetical protein